MLSAISFEVVNMSKRKKKNSRSPLNPLKQTDRDLDGDLEKLKAAMPTQYKNIHTELYDGDGDGGMVSVYQSGGSGMLVTKEFENLVLSDIANDNQLKNSDDTLSVIYKQKNNRIAYEVMVRSGVIYFFFRTEGDSIEFSANNCYSKYHFLSGKEELTRCGLHLTSFCFWHDAQTVTVVKQ